ncbi:MAG: hypothetical protein K0R17_1380 [Rariglobus sp.]|jgi:hypothetical protein|nr:hypothetical protein [Rariglobus sp.]
MIFAFTRGPERELRDRHPCSRLPGLIIALTLALTASLLPAADLAPGLAYLRPGADITPQTGSAILDLRSVTITNEASAAPLLAALQPGDSNVRRIVLVLVSPETPPGVRRQLATLPRCLTIGRAAPDFKTDITVTTSAEADRRASEVLAAGAAPEKLIVENADKPRYDETTLMREHTAGPEPTDSLEVTTSITTPSRPAEPVVVDAVLQRAVHIYRGLVVLKKN